MELMEVIGTKGKVVMIHCVINMNYFIRYTFVTISIIFQFFFCSSSHNGDHTEGTFVVKSGLAQMCKGGLIMDVVNVEQAKIAEEAGVKIFIHIVANPTNFFQFYDCIKYSIYFSRPVLLWLLSVYQPTYEKMEVFLECLIPRY